MNESDRIYTEIYNKAIEAGASKRDAFYAATDGVYQYKIGNQKPIEDLIHEKVKEAIK